MLPPQKQVPVNVILMMASSSRVHCLRCGTKFAICFEWAIFLLDAD